MNFNNESQVIQRIIEEYERRLQEQLALARQDIANELEQHIQVSGTGGKVQQGMWHELLFNLLHVVFYVFLII